MINLCFPTRVVKLLLFPHYVEFHSAFFGNTTGLFSLLAKNHVFLNSGKGCLHSPPIDTSGYWRKSFENTLPTFQWDGTLDSAESIAEGGQLLIRASTRLDLPIPKLVEFAKMNGHQVFRDDIMYTGFEQSWFDNLHSSISYQV